MSIPKTNSISSTPKSSTKLIKKEITTTNCKENPFIKEKNGKVIVTEPPYSTCEGEMTYETTEYDLLGRIMNSTSIDKNDKTGIISNKRYTEYNNNERQTKYIVEEDINKDGKMDVKSEYISIYDDNDNLREVHYIWDKNNDGQTDCTIITKYDENGKKYESKRDIYENGKIKISENIK